MSTLFTDSYVHYICKRASCSFILKLSYFLSYSKLYPALLYSLSLLDQQIIALFIAFSINLLIYLNIGGQLLYWLLKRQDNHGFPLDLRYSDMFNRKEINTYVLADIYNKSASFIMQIYPYVLWIPFIEISCELSLNSTNKSINV